MSINDIYNVSNLYKANTYMNVKNTSADKEMGQEQSLFGSYNNNGAQDNTSSLFVFPNSNEYDNADTAKNKNDGFLFM